MATRDAGGVSRLAERAAFLKDMIADRKTNAIPRRTGRVDALTKKFETKESELKKEKTPPLAMPESSDETPHSSAHISPVPSLVPPDTPPEPREKKKYFGRHLTSTRILHNIFGRGSEDKKEVEFKEKKETVVAISGAALKEPLLIRDAKALKKAGSAKENGGGREAADFEALRKASIVKKRIQETQNTSSANGDSSIVRRKSKRLSSEGGNHFPLPAFLRSATTEKILRPKSTIETKENDAPASAEPALIKEVPAKPVTTREKDKDDENWATRRLVGRVPSSRERRLPPAPPSIVVIPPPTRPLSRTMTAVEQRSLPPLYESNGDSGLGETRTEVTDGGGTTGRRTRRYMGSHTTSTFLEGRDAAPDASPRRHLIGFLHRTSHLSLTSELSADASFYLIGHRGRRIEDSTIGSESDARMFSDEDDRGSTTTDITSVSRQHENIRKRKNRRKYRQPSRASSFSSITESSMSLDVISVTLNMDTVNFLGISIVGQSSARGDNGIYVANIMKGGAVALDGRIEAGDMILQVNDISFENFTNDQAVDVLRDAVARKGPIKLTVAKCFENGPRSCFTVPRHRDEPVRPIDPHAWIAHTNAMRGMPSILEGSEGAPTPIPGEFTHGRPPSSSTVTSGSGGAGNGGTVVGPHMRLSVNTDKKKIVEAMAMPNSGLDIKNRTWLKIPIPMSFLGSDLVDWLLEHVDGLRERKDARRFAADLLKAKLIAHVVNKITFTEQCYYVLGDECADLARLRSVPEGIPPAPQGWRYQPNTGNAPSMASGYASLPSPHPYAQGSGQSYGPTPQNLPYPPAPPVVLPRGGADLHSQASGGSSSGSENRHNRAILPGRPPLPPGSGATGGGLELPHDMAASRQSFRMAMNQPLAMNQQPYEFFIDNI